MKQHRVKIFWKKNLIGEIIEPTTDMFFLYGKWKPENSPEKDDFLKEIDEKGEAVIQLHNIDNDSKAIVEVIPNEEIEIKIYPNL